MYRILTSLAVRLLLLAGTANAQVQPGGPDSPVKPLAKPDLNTGINFVTNQGRITSLDSLLKPHLGRVVYVDFWGTWCVPCRREMPYSARLKEKLKGVPVDFLYIAYENGYNASLIAKWKATVKQLNLTGRHFMMNPTFEGGLSEFLEVDSYPRYIIVDQTGEIVNDDAARPSETAEAVRQIKAVINP